MLDELMEERRELLDLVILIAAVSIVTAWSASLIRTLPLQWQIGILALVLLIATGYLSRTPLFTFTETKKFELPLSYDTEEETFLVPLPHGSEDLVNPIDRLWNIWKSTQSQAITGEDDLFFGDNRLPLADLVEFGILAVWSDRFDRSWDVETHDWSYTHGQTRRYTEATTREVVPEDLGATLKSNLFVEEEHPKADEDGPRSMALRALQHDGSTVFHVPPNTQIEDRSHREDEPSISLILENPYVRVHIRKTGYSGRVGPLSWAGQEPGALLQHLNDEDPVDFDEILELQERYRTGVIQLRASIEPKPLRALSTEAPTHWSWAEDLVDCLEKAAQYPTDNLTRVEYEGLE